MTLCSSFSRHIVTGVTCALVAFSALAQAQSDSDYPSRPITLVVPFAADGPTDKVARSLAAEMSQTLGQPIQIDNRPGLGGTRAPTEVAKAPADGYTLLIHHIGMATAPTLFRKLPYDPPRDFEPLGLVVDAPMVLLGRPTLPLNSARELVDFVRANQASVVVAYAGLGAASHLCELIFNTALGVDLISVPYKGTGPALRDLEKGAADIMCDQTTAATASIQAGKVKAFAVTLPSRVQILPDIPTTVEQGIDNLQLAIWHGLYAPRGTPAKVIATVSNALRHALASPGFTAAMAQVGVVPAQPDQATPKAHRAHLAAQIAKWRPILTKAGQFAD